MRLRVELYSVLRKMTNRHFALDVKPVAAPLPRHIGPGRIYVRYFGLMGRSPAETTAECQTERGDELPARIRRAIKRMTY